MVTEVRDWDASEDGNADATPVGLPAGDITVRQLKQWGRTNQAAVRRFRDRVDAVAHATQAGGVYLVAYEVTPQALTVGERYTFVADAADGGAVNINGLGVVEILRPGGVAPSAGEIVAGQVVEIVLTSTAAAQLVNGGGVPGLYQPANVTLDLLASLTGTGIPVLDGTTGAHMVAVGSLGEQLVGAAGPGAARALLGLGSAATADVGAAAGQVAAGNHAHAGVYQPAAVTLDLVASLSGTPPGLIYLSATGASSVTVSDHGAEMLAAATPAASRTVLGLGSAAIINTGTTAGQVVVLDGSGALPPVNGAALTGLDRFGVVAVGGISLAAVGGGTLTVMAGPAITITADTAANTLTIAASTTSGNVLAPASASAGHAVIFADTSGALLDDAGGPPALLSAPQSWTKPQAAAYVALTDAATVVVDLSLSANFTLSLGGARAMGAPTNAVAGQTGVIRISPNTYALAWNAAWKWEGGAPTLSTAAGAVDLIGYLVESDGTVTAWMGVKGRV